MEGDGRARAHGRGSGGERLGEKLTYLCSRSQPGLPTAFKVPKLFGRSQGLGVAPIQLVDDDVVEDEQFGLWSSMSEVFLE